MAESKSTRVDKVLIERKQLQEIEWMLDDDDGHSYCPVCGKVTWNGHATGCWLGNALKEVALDGE